MTQREIDRIEFQIDKLNDQNYMLRNKIDRLRSQLKHEGYLLKNSSGIQREQHNKNCWQLDSQVNECDNQIWQNEKEIHFLGSQLPRQKPIVQHSTKQIAKPSVQSSSYNSTPVSKPSSHGDRKTSKWGHFFKSIFYTLFLGPFFMVITDEVAGMTFESLGEWFFFIGLFLMGKGIYHFFKALS